ncbi:unnamed protein product [Darwinula stevensoni]|uniref:Uncharacterized protein n=1 Tax=Darwinula stevensoni TaxID=69355 RepID=A0A7R8WZ41_9CRUS|nr:unnamed protein product [Darwinula stevensoni]CAG0879654.1 unnamed protein product [Darwinula stevensoni]
MDGPFWMQPVSDLLCLQGQQFITPNAVGLKDHQLYMGTINSRSNIAFPSHSQSWNIIPPMSAAWNLVGDFTGIMSHQLRGTSSAVEANLLSLPVIQSLMSQMQEPSPMTTFSYPENSAALRFESKSSSMLNPEAPPFFPQQFRTRERAEDSSISERSKEHKETPFTGRELCKSFSWGPPSTLDDKSAVFITSTHIPQSIPHGIPIPPKVSTASSASSGKNNFWSRTISSSSELSASSVSSNLSDESWASNMSPPSSSFKMCTNPAISFILGCHHSGDTSIDSDSEDDTESRGQDDEDEGSTSADLLLELGHTFEDEPKPEGADVEVVFADAKSCSASSQDPSRRKVKLKIDMFKINV